jgi:hypothetical protein
MAKPALTGLSPWIFVLLHEAELMESDANTVTAICAVVIAVRR